MKICEVKGLWLESAARAWREDEVEGGREIYGLITDAYAFSCLSGSTKCRGWSLLNRFNLILNSFLRVILSGENVIGRALV